MNARLEFVIDKIKSNFQSLILGWGVLAFIVVPLVAMTIFNVKRELVTLTLLTTLAYWIIVFLWFSWKAKKEVN